MLPAGKQAERAAPALASFSVQVLRVQASLHTCQQHRTEGLGSVAAKRKYHLTLWRLSFLQVLGKGSYGTVCSALDRLTGERVAIKCLPNVFNSATDATRVLREIKLLRLLKHEGEGVSGLRIGDVLLRYSSTRGAVCCVWRHPAMPSAGRPALLAPGYKMHVGVCKGPQLGKVPAGSHRSKPQCNPNHAPCTVPASADVASLKHILLPSDPKAFSHLYVSHTSLNAQRQ